MSNPAHPKWKEKILREALSTDEAVWLYEHTQEWYFEADTDGRMKLRYLSSEPMPMREQPAQAPQAPQQGEKP